MIYKINFQEISDCLESRDFFDSKYDAMRLEFIARLKFGFSSSL